MDPQKWDNLKHHVGFCDVCERMASNPHGQKCAKSLFAMAMATSYNDGGPTTKALFGQGVVYQKEKEKRSVGFQDVISYKVETPYHDNDLILDPIISLQSGWQ